MINVRHLISALLLFVSADTLLAVTTPSKLPNKTKKVTFKTPPKKDCLDDRSQIEKDAWAVRNFNKSCLFGKHSQVIKVLTEYERYQMQLHNKKKVSVNFNIFLEQYEDTTPLHQAVKNNYFDLVTTLLQFGANPTLKDKNGKKPVDYTNNDDLRFILQDAELE